MIWEKETNPLETTKADDIQFSNQHSTVLNSKTDLSKDATSRAFLPLTSGDEDPGRASMHSIFKDGENVIPQAQECNLERNMPKSLTDFPLLGSSTPTQKPLSCNGNLLLDGLGTLPASFPLFLDSSSSGDQMAEGIVSSPPTHASSGIQDQEDSPNWASLSSNSIPFLESDEITTLSCTMQMNKQPSPRRTVMQEKKKKRKVEKQNRTNLMFFFSPVLLLFPLQWLPFLFLPSTLEA